MSLPLKDLRLGIPESVDIWLDIEAETLGVDKAAIARDVLLGWMRRKVHAHRVATRRLAANGVTPAPDGIELEDDGVRRNRSRR